MTFSISILDPVFSDYEKLAAEADALFARVRQLYPECVTCASGCSDCCNALFDLSLVEAMYINHKFTTTFAYGSQRSAIMQAAAETDRPLAKLKRKYYEELRDSGKEAVQKKAAPESAVQQAIGEVMEKAAKARVRCPLLLADDTCALYDARPITCRLYGIPVQIEGKSHVCGRSAFTRGKSYPAVQIEKIQDRLDALSLRIRDILHSRYSELHKVYVPVSMALLTKYDANYLGISGETE